MSYYKCLIETQIEEVNEDGSVTFKDPLPCEIYSLTAALQGYIKERALNGVAKNTKFIAWIHVKSEDTTLIQNYAGFVTDDLTTLKNNNKYKTYYPYTVKQNKNKYNDAGELIEEYDRLDGDDSFLFFGEVVPEEEPTE